MTISVGDKLPAATFKEKTADGPVEITTDQLFSGKKVVLFAVPGAFTPTCSLNHLPAIWKTATLSWPAASMISPSSPSTTCM